jgi:cyclic beta-1,2-glucan synthetase
LRAPWLEGAPHELARNPRSYVFNNGAVGVELYRDGRGAAFVMGAERGGAGIDLIRRPLEPLQARGHFFYVAEDGREPWSIGFEPARNAGDYRIEEPAFQRLVTVHTVNGIEARMEVGPDPRQAAVISWRIRLTDKSGADRRVRLASFCEVAGHETDAYARDLDFAGMHVETIFVRALNAILARNRLLRSARADRGETAFFAVKPGAGAELVGYEDSRTRFLGEGSLAKPTGCERWRWRKLDDEGKLWTFDPAASFTLEMTLSANGSAEAEFVMGRADNAVWAAELIAARLGLPPISEPDLEERIYETRSVEPSHALHERWPFALSGDGKRLDLTQRTPRPWAHVLANELGMATMASNDGEIFSAFGNARQNGLTAFRFGSATVVQPGQVVYLRDLDAGETDSTAFVPFQRDETFDVAYEPGVATFVKTRGDLVAETVVFTPPDRPCDVRIVTLRNMGARPKRLRVVPFFDIALEESPNESVGKIRDETVGSTLLFQNRLNDFERGFAFAATSLERPTTETVRTRFFGGPGRDIHSPAFVETGAPDGSAADDGRRVAAFSGELEVPPGGEAKLVIVLGQARSRDEALACARRVKVAEAEADLAAARASWAARLGKVEVRTNRPDFDQLVNTWLPYQLYASRLWGRVGPNQRGGATGYRDQLQDVLPLSLNEPRLTRAQIVLHSAQQFLEGDVLKWWHRAPNGGTGLGQRTKASDPHLWLPYVLARYVRATGDASVLDEVTPFLEAEPVPEGQETWIVIPRTSRESATVYEHARLTIAFTLRYLGENGLPLLRAGDWNDGIDALGRLDIGTSVWMGFFFANVLDGFIPLARLKGDEAFASICSEALAGQRAALDVGWRGDHYALDFADDGEVVGEPNAMTTGWAAYSGACDDARALAALEGGLKTIERPDRVVLLETPFYEHSRPYPGRIADYPPGVRENGGQYSHGASWIVDGFVRLAVNARTRGETTKRRSCWRAPSRSSKRSRRSARPIPTPSPSTASSRSNSRPTSTTARATAAGAAGPGTRARPPACSQPPTPSSGSSRRTARSRSATTCSSRKGRCRSRSCVSGRRSGESRREASRVQDVRLPRA